MDSPETLATLDTQDTRRRQNPQKTQKNAKYHNTPTALAKEKCRRTAEESRTTRTQPKV
jgi:hypothetical protein